MKAILILSPKQNQGVEHARQKDFIHIFWWKPGEGKTRLALACACISGVSNIYIIAPEHARNIWLEEIIKTKFTIPFQIFSADSLSKFPVWDSFENSMLIVDELYYFANPSAHRTKLLKSFSQFFSHRIGLSGTIQPASDNISIYGQLSAMNLEKQLVPRGGATAFRSLYQEKKLQQIYFSGGRRNVISHINLPNAQKQIIEKISPWVHVNFPTNTNRNIRESEIHIELSLEQRSMIEQIRNEYRLKLSNGEVLDYKFAIEVLMSVQSVTNGWLGSPHSLFSFENSKLKRLKGILDPLIAAGEKVVIWCAFRNDVFYLEQVLKPWKTIRFIGGEEFNQTAWNRKDCQICLATIASGSSVNYFGNVEYAIYYSFTNKLRDFQQSKGRHERKDSKHSGAYYYYLLSKYPAYDEKIFRRLQKNQECESSVIQDFAKEFLT